MFDDEDGNDYGAGSDYMPGSYGENYSDDEDDDYEETDEEETSEESSDEQEKNDKQ